MGEVTHLNCDDQFTRFVCRYCVFLWNKNYHKLVITSIISQRQFTNEKLLLFKGESSGDHKKMQCNRNVRVIRENP
jgi:hypothetical protein